MAEGKDAPKEKSSLKEAYRSARAESAISARRLIATAAAAVTMALVSSRLTSVLNSLILVAVVSIGSALVSEFYRVLLSVTAEGTKKVAETTKRAIDPLVSLGHSDDAPTEVIDLPDVEETKVQEGLPVQVAGTDSDDVLTGDADQGSDKHATGPGEHETPEEPDSFESQKSRGLSHAKSAIKTNPFVQLSLLFGVVALLTVGVSYAVASSQGKTDITYNYSSFRKDPLDELTTSQKQDLVELVKNLNTSQGEEPPEEGSTEDVPDGSESDSSTDTEPPKTALEELAAVQDELADLTAQNQDFVAVIDDLKSQLASETSKTDELQQRIDELEAQIAILTGATAPEPTP